MMRRMEKCTWEKETTSDRRQKCRRCILSPATENMWMNKVFGQTTIDLQGNTFPLCPVIWASLPLFDQIFLKRLFILWHICIFIYINLFIIYCRYTQAKQSRIAESLWGLWNQHQALSCDWYKTTLNKMSTLKAWSLCLPLSKPLYVAQLRPKVIQSALKRNRNTLQTRS